MDAYVRKPISLVELRATLARFGCIGSTHAPERGVQTLCREQSTSCTSAKVAPANSAPSLCGAVDLAPVPPPTMVVPATSAQAPV